MTKALIPDPLRKIPYELKVPLDKAARGSNIVCRMSDMTNEPTVWDAMIKIWDWDGWIKPQIDDAAAICNSVRLWGSTTVVATGLITMSQYLDRWRQILDYCVSIGIEYIFVTGGDNPLPHATQKEAIDVFVPWVKLLTKYPQVIGVDVCNEAALGPIWWPETYNAADTIKLVETLTSVVRYGGLPATASYSFTDVSTLKLDRHIRYFKSCDFLSFHIYNKTTAGAFFSNISSYPYMLGKPLIIGEFGIDATETSANRTAFYQDIQTMAVDSNCAGSFAWSTYDVGGGNLKGLYSAPGVLRNDIAVPFNTFPITR